MPSPVQTIVNAVLGTGTPPAADPARLAADLDALDLELDQANAAFAEAALAEASGAADAATARARAEMVRDRLAGRREALAAALSRAQANVERDAARQEAAARRLVWRGVRAANAARDAAGADLAAKLAALAEAFRKYQGATRALTATLPAPPPDTDGSKLNAGMVEGLMVLELKRLGVDLGCDVSNSILFSMPTFKERLDEAGRVVESWIPADLAGEDA